MRHASVCANRSGARRVSSCLNRTMNKSIKIALLTLIVVFVALQLYPVDRSNPPARGAMDLPPGETGEVLRAACLDCHSHETVWPWYARVAPASFFVASHVDEGREHLNFSTWGSEDAESRDHMMEEIVEVLEEGEMPLRSYTLLHPEARLTDAQRDLLVGWARQQRAALDFAGGSEHREGDDDDRGGRP